MLRQLTKAVVERALQAEMVAHLGHDKHEAVDNPAGNARIGSSRKTLKGEFGELLIEILRDWQGSFEKHQIRWTGSCAIYSAAKVEEAEQHFAAFGDKWDRDYPAIGARADGATGRASRRS